MTVKDDTVHVAVSKAEGETETLVAEKALIAVGRRPLSDEIGIENLGIATDRDYIAVNESMQTSTENVYAIGDVVATPALAHLASHEGILAMQHLAGQPAVPINYDLVPNCTYCSPEVASVGLTEQAAVQRGIEVETSKFPYAAIGKATILGANGGFVKLVSDKKYKQILGVHMVGPQVSELIAEGAALIGLEATAADLSHLIHPHPTLSEGIMDAAHALYNGVPIHL
jgi:dihydrolipoamide dehydrogenase